MERQLIQTYDNFLLMGVFRNGTLLYKETAPKPLPTDAENYRKIQGFEQAICVTEEEKNDGKSTREYKYSRDGAMRLSQERRRHVEFALTDNTKTKASICREFKMSMKTLDKIKREMSEKAVKNHKSAKYIVDGTELSLRQYCDANKLNYYTVIDRMKRGKETWSLIPHEIIKRESNK